MKKKNLLLTIVISVVLLSFVGCKDKGITDPVTNQDEGKTQIAEVIMPEWTLEIEGAKDISSVSSSDVSNLTVKSIEMIITSKNGDSTTNIFTGISLSDILNELAITEFESIIVTADDGFEAEYSKELVLDEETLLAWGKDGEAFDGDQPIRMCPKNGSGNQFIKNTKKITIQ